MMVGVSKLVGSHGRMLRDSIQPYDGALSTLLSQRLSVAIEVDTTHP